MTKKQKYAAVLEALAAAHPDARPELNFENPFQLLIATILSAQCTDVRVNIVTEKLFPLFPDAAALAALTPEELEVHIKTCGLSKTKAKNIVATCRILQEKYGGRVPDDREALEELPGVGRKTANVVLSNAFGVPAIAVDTHVFRVSNRIGLAEADDVWKTEQQLMKNIPQDTWSIAHHWLIFHGRRVCKAQKPLCDTCTVAPLCSYCKQLQKKR